MQIHQKFDTLQQYKAFFLDLTSWCDTDRRIWKTEDLPRLEPFFQYKPLDKQPWTEEIQQSFSFYKKCLKEYGDDNTEKRDSLQGFSDQQLGDIFGFTQKDEEDEDLDWIPQDLPQFPFIVTGAIESTFDRFGNCTNTCIRFVSQEEFDV